MEKKNTLLLTVIAVATLLVAVVGATFAFFTASQDINAQVNVTATTGTVASFQSTVGDSISFTVDGSKMLASNVDNTTPKGTDDGTLTVKLSGDAGSSCTYDIIYTDTSATKYVEKVAGEFTLEGKSEPNAGTLAVTNYKTYANASGMTVITDAVITIGAGATSAEQLWTFTAKFYNLNGDQNGLDGKTYGGYFKVNNVRC